MLRILRLEELVVSFTNRAKGFSARGVLMHSQRFRKFHKHNSVIYLLLPGMNHPADNISLRIFDEVVSFLQEY